MLREGGGEGGWRDDPAQGAGDGEGRVGSGGFAEGGEESREGVGVPVGGGGVEGEEVKGAEGHIVCGFVFFFFVRVFGCDRVGLFGEVRSL